MLTSRVLDLVAEGVDLAIRAGRLADSSLVVRKVGTTHSGLFASKTYLERRGRPRRVAELAQHDCVLFRGRGGHSSWQLEGPGRDETIEVTGHVSCDDFSFARPAIEAGLGIGPLPLLIGESRDAVIERVLPRFRFEGAPLHVVMPSASFVPARVAIVRDFFVAYLSELLSSSGGRAA